MARQNPCPRCGEHVQICVFSQPRVPGSIRQYGAKCTCGLMFDYLGDDGTKRSARDDWNRLSQDEILRNAYYAPKW